jgi:hypothetical protein
MGRLFNVVPESRIRSWERSQEVAQVGDGESGPGWGRNWRDLTRGFTITFDDELLAPIYDAVDHIGKRADDF